ncbi:lysophospholipid acyltransferase family protein [Candidatus Uabimicrobium sp. HlEnr_7]|uniref:lysophospholipid acyltransferase family protein n=1 Tax=Candidatus Uabimicrobium helgolandensis TaxID=3095367 RepID=UPI0035586FF9
MKKTLHIPWWEKILLTIIPPIVAGLMKLLCLTYRVVHVQGDRKAILKKHDGRAVFCTWHQRMFYHFHFFGSLHVTMMISASKDGEWAASIARLLGFKYVRGSTRKKNIDKGGKNAMEKLIDMVDQGESAGILVDGPTGPNRKVKIGAVLIAQKTGAPLLSEMWGCKSAWVLKSWDRHLIPKPFTKIYVIHSEPIYVPKDANREELEKIRLRLEKVMNEDVEKCDAYFYKNSSKS